MRRGSITTADQEFVETWENVSPAMNAIIRLDARGDEKTEIISGRRKFMVSTEERKILSDRVVDERNDPFCNGAFRPIIVPDSVNVESNPNALSDEEIGSIFKASDLAFGEWLSNIDSPETLTRMLDLADRADISLQRYKALGARLGEVKPRTRIQQKDADEYASIGPAGGDPQPRRRGGRSQDYR